MQYLLEKEEFDNLIDKKKYNEVVGNLLDECSNRDKTIEKLKYEIMKNRPCPQRDFKDGYCDGCPLGIENLKVCTTIQNYSK